MPWCVLFWISLSRAAPSTNFPSSLFPLHTHPTPTVPFFSCLVNMSLPCHHPPPTSVCVYTNSHVLLALFSLGNTGLNHHHQFHNSSTLYQFLPCCYSVPFSHLLSPSLFCLCALPNPNPFAPAASTSSTIHPLRPTPLRLLQISLSRTKFLCYTQRDFYSFPPCSFQLQYPGSCKL
ncbi:hypothetical protein BDQ17DRAFT_669149 [Cyathus striatus]|nr:hypothetical protein BDQ17DRAFT_669149 [Cyathus striatus]